MRPRLRMIFSISPTVVTASVAALIAAGTYAICGRNDETMRVETNPYVEELDRVLPEVRLADVPFEVAVQDLSRQVGVDVRFTPRARESIRQHAKPVTVRLRNVKARKVLQTFLGYGQTEIDQLVLDYDEHGVIVSLRDEEPLSIDEQAFWMGDLLVQSIDADHRRDVIEQIENLIETTIAVDLWDRPGVRLWTDPSVEILHLSHSPWVVREVRTLFGKLREGRGPQADTPLQILAGMEQ